MANSLITPLGDALEIDGSVQIGTDAIPQALNVKGNIVGGANLTIAGTITGNISGINTYNNLYQQGLINGNFDVWQRGTSYSATPLNDDAKYICDRWINIQSTSNAWTFSQETSIVPDNSMYALKCLLSTGTNKQCGIVQILEQKDAKKFYNKTVSVSFRARNISSISNLRCAVLSWTGTADSPARDVVGTWAGAGTNPTWATNWTMENTPVNLALTSSYQTFKIENITVDTSGMKNLAVVIWSDDTTVANGNGFYISQVQLNIGTTAFSFMPNSYNIEFQNCLRYLFRLDVANGTGSSLPIWGNGAAIGSSTAYVIGMAPVAMRTTPTIAYSSISNLYHTDYITTTQLVGILLDSFSDNRCLILYLSTSGGLTTYRPGSLNVSSSGWLQFDAEL